MGADHGNPGALPVSWKGIRMRQLRAFFFRLAGLFRKDRRDRDLSAEMETHLTMHLEDNLRAGMRSEEHTSELQSPYDLVCRLLLEKKKKKTSNTTHTTASYNP